MRAQVITCVRLNNTVWGNPRYEYTFQFEDGLTLSGKSKSDARWCYNPPRTGDWVLVQYHYTKAGNVIIDDMGE